jgi:hypothetical protein
MFQIYELGPRMMPCPALPKVPGAGSVKTAG